MLDANGLEALSKLADVIIPFGTFILGKAMKGGANQILVDQATAKIKELEATVLSHSLTISAHTVLHGQYAASDAKISEVLGRLEASESIRSNLLYKIAGRLEIDL